MYVIDQFKAKVYAAYTLLESACDDLDVIFDEVDSYTSNCIEDVKEQLKPVIRKLYAKEV